MNPIETRPTDPNYKYNHAESEWQRLIFVGERHMLGGNYAMARTAYLAALSYAKSFASTHSFWNKTLANVRYLYVNYLCARAANVGDLIAATVPEWENVLGENHFFIALWLEKCTKMAENAEQYALAEQMYHKMLACWEAAPHLTVRARQMRQLDCLFGIAHTRFAQGNHAGAFAQFAAVVTKAEMAWGPDHPQMVRYLDDAAEAAHQQGEYKQEARYAKRADHIRRYNSLVFANADNRNRAETERLPDR